MIFKKKQKTMKWLRPRCNNNPWVDSTCFGLHELSKEPSLRFGDYYIIYPNPRS